MRPFRVPEQLLLPWSPRQTISTAHAAEMLDVSPDTVLDMIEDGTIKAYKMRDKRNSPWRVSYDSVLAHLDHIHLENGLEKRF
jgi:excisionase family DNA binding protein